MLFYVWPAFAVWRGTLAIALPVSLIGIFLLRYLFLRLIGTDLIARRVLVLGTGNRKKGRELAGLLSSYDFGLRTLADFPNAIEVVEDGDSFAANARLKATQQARHLQQWVVGEDSGLVVDALGGGPPRARGGDVLPRQAMCVGEIVTNDRCPHAGEDSYSRRSRMPW